MSSNEISAGEPSWWPTDQQFDQFIVGDASDEVRIRIQQIVDENPEFVEVLRDRQFDLIAEQNPETKNDKNGS